MTTLDSSMFKAMITNGYLDLKKHLKEVNDLNVFPVPDGDTGSNMGATMSGGVEAFQNLEESSVGKIAEAMAKGMLMAARGNSGVILSQFFAGLADALKEFKDVPLPAFAEAMEAGVRSAYSVVVKPVEGTILTVMREGCEFALSKVTSSSTYAEYFTWLISKMKESLERTPELLPILKEAGVIDSGGAGLVYIVEGMGQAIGGKIIEDVSFDFETRKVDLTLEAFNEDTPLDYGYCTEFILQLSNAKNGPKEFSLDALIKHLEIIGDSIVAFQNGTLVKVHVHTKTPDKAISYAQRFGEFVTFKMENMALQHNETLIEKSRHRAFNVEPMGERKPLAIIAVAPTEEIAAQMENYGVSKAIVCGELMNPSPNDFLKAFEQANADQIILLPNNGNEILVAEQAIKMFSGSKIHLIKTTSIAQGIGVASVLDIDNLAIEENLKRAKTELENAISIEVAKAIRGSKYDSLTIEKDEYVALVNGKAVANGKYLSVVFTKALEKIEGYDERSVMTMFFGKEVKEEERKMIEDASISGNPFLEFYSFDGGQAIYQIIAVLD